MRRYIHCLINGERTLIRICDSEFGDWNVVMEILVLVWSVCVMFFCVVTCFFSCLGYDFSFYLQFLSLYNFNLLLQIWLFRTAGTILIPARKIYVSFDFFYSLQHDRSWFQIYWKVSPGSTTWSTLRYTFWYWSF